METPLVSSEVRRGGCHLIQTMAERLMTPPNKGVPRTLSAHSAASWHVPSQRKYCSANSSLQIYDFHSLPHPLGVLLPLPSIPPPIPAAGFAL